MGPHGEHVEPGPWAPVESTWNAVSRTGSVLPGAVRARGGSVGGKGSPLSLGIFRSCSIPSNLVRSRCANEEMESYPSSAICSFVTSSLALPETGRGASSFGNKKRASSAFGAVTGAAGGCTQTSWSLMHRFACLGKRPLFSCHLSPSVCSPCFCPLPTRSCNGRAACPSVALWLCKGRPGCLVCPCHKVLLIALLVACDVVGLLENTVEGCQLFLGT